MEFVKNNINSISDEELVARYCYLKSGQYADSELLKAIALAENNLFKDNIDAIRKGLNDIITVEDENKLRVDQFKSHLGLYEFVMMGTYSERQDRNS